MPQEKMNAAEVEREYLSRRLVYEGLVVRLCDLLESLLEEENVPISQIEGRAKDHESFCEKTKRKSYVNPFEGMKDIAGLRVVTYYPDDVGRVTQLIRREFDIDDENSNDKIEDLGVGEFGYRSFHLICSLGENRAKLPEWKAYATLSFEIQVRSVLQHAWAAISHKLDYKSATEAPTPLRRKLFRLSALLEMADEEFALIRDRSDEIIEGYKVNVHEGNLAIPIDLDSLREYFDDLVKLKSWVDLGLTAGMKEVQKSTLEEYGLDESSLRRLHAVLNELKVENLGSMRDLLDVSSKSAVSLLKPLAKKTAVYAIPLDVAAFTVVLAENSRLPKALPLPDLKPEIMEALEELRHK